MLSGEITAKDPTDPIRNSPSKLFTVRFEKDWTYVIDMKSNQLDSYLILTGTDGRVLAQDDDGGGYPSARIIHRAAQAGKHRIITTYFANASGAFELTIRQTD